MFWLHMNKGLWFSSPKKIMLKILNVFSICVGVALVSHTTVIPLTLKRSFTDKNSVSSASMLQDQLFIIVLAALVFHVLLTMPEGIL
jgi:hypothetical protein